MHERILKVAVTLAACLPALAMAQQRPTTPQRPTTTTTTQRPTTTTTTRTSTLSAAAHRGDGIWEFSAGIGLMWLDRAFAGNLIGGRGFANTATPGHIIPAGALRLGYNFDRNWGLSFGTALGLGSGVKYLTWFAAVTGTHDLNAKTSPFVTLGTQMTRVTGNGLVIHPTFGFHLGVGVRHMIREDVALRIEGRMADEHYAEMPAAKTVYNSILTVGLSRFFGGHRRAGASSSTVRTDTVRYDHWMDRTAPDLPVLPPETILVYIPEMGGQVVMRVQFVTDSTGLLPVSRAVLDTVAAAIKATPHSLWEVQGHTDSRGTPEHNQALSWGRANSVVEYLVNKGVDRRILTAIGFGPDRPVAPNDTPENMAKNRRVQLRRYPPTPTGPALR